MNQIALEAGIILALLATNGLFAMTELAVVSARKSQLKRLAEQGDARARAVLDLVESPNRFLATVQVGITLVGVLAGAFGGATIAEEISRALAAIPALAPYSKAMGIAAVVLGITYCSLVIGELVPKRLALAHPERIARVMAGPINRLSIMAGPAVRFLSGSTDLILRLFGVRSQAEHKVSNEEIRVLMEEGRRTGVFHQAEPKMVERVLQLDSLRARDLMTPRAKIIWINLHDQHETIWHKIVVSGHTTFPVYADNRDNVVGMLSIKAVYANLAAGAPVNVRDLMTPPMFVPATQTAITLLEQFRHTGKSCALVLDEFGGIIGLVTLHDVMEAVLGDFPSQDDRLKPTAKRRPDGSWLVDGLMEAAEFERVVTEFRLDPPAARTYQTFGGYVLQRLGRVPTEGDCFEEQGFQVEIVDMDHQRVDKVLLMPLKKGS